MWEPRRLTIPWAFTVCYKDSYKFYLYTIRKEYKIEKDGKRKEGNTQWKIR
jgi:hypothetical protein